MGLALLCFSFTLGAYLDAVQLVLPESLEGFRPLVERPDRVRIRSIEHSPPVASDIHEPHLSQHTQMLGDRWLAKP